MNRTRKHAAVLQKAGYFLENLIHPVIAIFLGLVICSIIILAIGENPIRVYGVILQGGFGSGYSLMNTLTRSIPIILTGLGAVIAWRAGYINIGGEGQMILGGFVTTICALYLPVGGPIGMVISLIAGMIAGGAVALFSAWLEKRLAVMILITTLLFNYIIDYIVYYFVAFPFKDPSNGGIAIKTYVIDKSLWLPKIGNVRGSLFHSGFIIALAVFAVVLFIIKKTAFGYESKMTGLNPSFARYGGVRSAKIMFLTMFLSGAIAALGGRSRGIGCQAFVHAEHVHQYGLCLDRFDGSPDWRSEPCGDSHQQYRVSRDPDRGNHA